MSVHLPEPFGLMFEPPESVPQAEPWVRYYINYASVLLPGSPSFTDPTGFNRFEESESLRVKYSFFREDHSLERTWSEYKGRFTFRKRDWFSVDDKTFTRTFFRGRFMVEETIRTFFSNFTWQRRYTSYRSSFVTSFKIESRVSDAEAWQSQRLLETGRIFLDSLHFER